MCVIPFGLYVCADEAVYIEEGNEEEEDGRGWEGEKKKEEGLLCYCSSHPAFKHLRVASATYNSVNTRACAAEIQYQVTNDEDGMPIRGARLQSYRRDARAEPET